MRAVWAIVSVAATCADFLFFLAGGTAVLRGPEVRVVEKQSGESERPPLTGAQSPFSPPAPAAPSPRHCPSVAPQAPPVQRTPMSCLGPVRPALLRTGPAGLFTRDSPVVPLRTPPCTTALRLGVAVRRR